MTAEIWKHHLGQYKEGFGPDRETELKNEIYEKYIKYIDKKRTLEDLKDNL